MELFRAENLSFRYAGQQENALDNLTFSIRRGEFILLTGVSGSGKTTLLRHLKPILTPHGTRVGRLLYKGCPLEETSPLEQAASIGYVTQEPDAQLVTDKVWHELAFGLENLGISSEEIRLRCAEVSDRFGLTHKFHADISTLSGGQKQLLNLAAVLALAPDMLLLDEPTASLDPSAVRSFLQTLKAYAAETGATVFLSCHHLEEVYALADRVLALENGRLIIDEKPAEAAGLLARTPLFHALPAYMRLGRMLDDQTPLSLEEGRQLFERRYQGGTLPAAQEPAKVQQALTFKDVWFRYAHDGEDILRGVDLSLHAGEAFCLFGANGAGKSTLLKLAAGLLKPQRGRVALSGRAAYLPQDTRLLFARETAKEELTEVAGGDDVAETAQLLGLSAVLDAHPFDLSSGEAQRLGLAKLLLTRPDILLLDEPTGGLDAACRRSLLALLKKLKDKGLSLLIASHDTEFCASLADRAGLVFDGGLLAEGAARELLCGGQYYTTAANRMARSLCPQALTLEELVSLCGK